MDYRNDNFKLIAENNFLKVLLNVENDMYYLVDMDYVWMSESTNYDKLMREYRVLTKISYSIAG